MGGHTGSTTLGPPLLSVGPCRSLREAGELHGRAAAGRIRAFLEAEEMVRTRSFFADLGPDGLPSAASAAFAELRADNAVAFPEYALEIEGIAEGAGVPVLDIWMVNLLCEVQALKGLPIGKRAEHCSDVILMGEADDLWHGHNEDYTDDPLWHDLVYFVKYEASSDANFTPVMGFCYPGMIPGFAMTWGGNGLMLTQNSLFPPAVNRRGLGCTFVARCALEAETMEGALLQLMRPGQALGMSVNLIELPTDGKSPRACNVEVHGVAGTAALQWLGDPLGSTLMHFNVYSNLAVGNANNPRNSAARQARASTLLMAAPSRNGGAADVLSVLADSRTNTAFPIFGPTTMASWLLDARAGVVSVWARSRPGQAPPLHRWEVDGFFGGGRWSRSAAPLGRDVLRTVSEASLSSRPPLALQRGVHRADLRLRQEVGRGVAKALQSRRDCAAAMAEVNAMRKELLQQIKLGTLGEEAAVQAFRLKLGRLLQVWPLDQGRGGAGGSTGDEESVKEHDVDLMLRKELGLLLRAKTSAADNELLQSSVLVELRRDVVRRVRVGEVPPEGARAAFRVAVAQLRGRGPEDEESEGEPTTCRSFLDV